MLHKGTGPSCQRRRRSPSSSSSMQPRTLSCRRRRRMTRRSRRRGRVQVGARRSSRPPRSNLCKRLYGTRSHHPRALFPRERGSPAGLQKLRVTEHHLRPPPFSCCAGADSHLCSQLSGPRGATFSTTTREITHWGVGFRHPNPHTGCRHAQMSCEMCKTHLCSSVH